MATTLKQLEKRVSAVEKKLAKVMKVSKTAAMKKGSPGTQRNGKNGKKVQPKPEPEQKIGWAAIAKPGSWIAKQLAMQPEISRLADKVFAEMGITGEPTMDPKTIRERMIERGVRPEDNEFTRELIKMREET
ncbi:hypothetical protein L0337_36750 [candidate division KSB1 bacterium]|nr:hypothetical protein [candidate division KSB1 bacterium]